MQDIFHKLDEFTFQLTTTCIRATPTIRDEAKDKLTPLLWCSAERAQNSLVQVHALYAACTRLRDVLCVKRDAQWTRRRGTRTSESSLRIFNWAEPCSVVSAAGDFDRTGATKTQLISVHALWFASSQLFISAWKSTSIFNHYGVFFFIVTFSTLQTHVLFYNSHCCLQKKGEKNANIG